MSVPSALALLAVHACALAPREAPHAPPRPVLTPRMIEQRDHGQDAAFVLCAARACPEPTPKTLALASAEAIRAVSATRTDAAPAPPAEVHRLLVSFAPSSALLTREARHALAAELAAARRATHILLRGRTDSQGAAAVNERLALLRALAVRDFLLRRGLSEEAIELDVRGACCYVADNATAPGRAQNRRVEVELVLGNPKGAL